MAWHDDPRKDYRHRDQWPKHWLLQEDPLFAVDYLGYTRAVMSLLPAGAALCVLDAGCGDGYVSHLLVERGYEVVGVDYSARAIAFARLLVDGATFMCLDLRDLPQQPEFQHRFDVVVAVEVLEHIPPAYHRLVCGHLAWALQASGRLILSVPSLHLRPSPLHYTHFRLDDLHALLHQAGLTPEQTLYQHRLSWLYSRRLWKLLRTRAYDLVAVRRALSWLFWRRYNLGRPGGRVGRYIVVCSKAR